MSDKQEKKNISEVFAQTKAVHISPRKLRLLTVMIKGLPVDQAIIQLGFKSKKGTEIIQKLLNTGIADAGHNFDVKRENLYIKNLTVDEGQVYKRYKPRAQGRAFPIRKRTSHVRLVLGVAEKPLSGNKLSVGGKKVVKAESKTEEKTDAKKSARSVDQNKKSGWFGKKDEGAAQARPKGPKTGVQPTGVARTGNK